MTRRDAAAYLTMERPSERMARQARMWLAYVVYLMRTEWADWDRVRP